MLLSFEAQNYSFCADLPTLFGVETPIIDKCTVFLDQNMTVIVSVS